MSPSIRSLGVATAALASSALANGIAGQAGRYDLDHEYTSKNFFDMWDFRVSDYEGYRKGGYSQWTLVDPSNGFVNYRNEKDARDMGIIAEQGDEVVVGVNHGTVMPEDLAWGRDSVRLESKKWYNKGLLIADFTHLPKPACGAWPAFWMYGGDESWPKTGEVDIFETWNQETKNLISLHADHESVTDSCRLPDPNEEASGNVVTTNCDNYYAHFGDGVAKPQYGGNGCGMKEANPFPNGAVYGMEWSSNNISVWTWPRDQAPEDVKSAHPNPRGWGKPSYHISQSSCNIDKVLKEQRLVMNLDFCGDLAGEANVWKYGGCQAIANQKTCKEYVAANPDAYSDVFFKIAGIKYFQLNSSPSTTTTTTTQTTTVCVTVQ